MISSIFTSLVDSYMSEQLKINTAKEVEADKIMKEKLTAINKAKKMNSSWTINTGTTTQISTGIISTWLSYPLIKQ